MKKYAVITFLFNNYDLLREPLIVDENADYYCMTDDKSLTSGVWKIIYIEDFDNNQLTGIQKTYKENNTNKLFDNIIDLIEFS